MIAKLGDDQVKEDAVTAEARWSRRNFLGVIGVFLVGIGLFAPVLVNAAKPQDMNAMPSVTSDESAYELRIYQIAAGEMGLMQDIFRDLLTPMLDEYSIEGVGYWATPDDATLYYIVRHASLDMLASNWERLHADPHWTSGLDERGQGRTVVTDVQSVPLVGVSGLAPARGLANR